MKGAMQCPNCRKIERGRWLFANGSARSFPEFSMDDWTPDEETYDFNYSEMDSFPSLFTLAATKEAWVEDVRENFIRKLDEFGRIRDGEDKVIWRASKSGVFSVWSFFVALEVEGEVTFPPKILWGSWASTKMVFFFCMESDLGTDPNYRPTQEERMGFGREVESPSTTHHDLQGHHAILSEHAAASSAAHSYVAYFGPIPPTHSNSSESVDDLNFNHHWNSLSAHTLPATLRSMRGESDAMTRSGSFVHPLLFGPGSGHRAGSAFVSSIVPNHPGNSMPTSIVPGVRRFNGPRALPPVVPAASQSDHSAGFYIFPPSGASIRNIHEAENPSLNHFHAWDSGWGSFHQATGGSDSGSRSSSFWRHWS
ncbi:E3 ubiquitin-protein ligase RFI2 [Vitis vinifera]|uniref:E3 ubiquitin-protein ligase RFI2 n=1 Tax=Vitis vinifera TaxID=29760 RepID=A0A438F3Q0_VITVI|nr:E3 ubiquitin-protein ligase RFI2 [Vitis vinifera]